MTDAASPDTARNALTVRALCVTFAPGARPAVHDVSFDVAAGETVAILGPSGSGKSTLLRAVAGLERLDTGSVSWQGRDLAATPVHRRGFALMFQDGQLFPHRTAASNIAYPLQIAGVRAAERRERVDELLALVGLTGMGGRAVPDLSGGEQQRVALARSLAARPRLMLLDEPLSSLDRELRDRLAADLRRILTTTGTTALFVTHDQEEAFTVADRVGVMIAGRLVRLGRPDEVWRSPGSWEIARFLGYTTLLDADAARRVLPDADSAVALRPAAFTTVAGADSGGSFPATVLRSTPSLGGTRLRIELDGIGEVDAVAAPGQVVAVGDVVAVRFDPAAAAPVDTVPAATVPTPAGTASVTPASATPASIGDDG